VNFFAKYSYLTGWLICLILIGALPLQAHTLDLRSGKVIPIEKLVDDLLQARVIFVGELHDQPSHHQAQLQIIRALHEKGAKVAIGLEMFRRDGQPVLDQWVNGNITEEEFLPIYEDHWSMWPQYRFIFRYARQSKIPMLGLNINRRITAQVARNGFSSLSDQDRNQLPTVRCDVSEAYQTFIRKTLGGHPMSETSFMNFCEAQMVWDGVMADNLAEYLKENPQTIVVVLAGSGHAWKYGIPEQLKRLSDIEYRVVLPEVMGRIDQLQVGEKEADYLLLGVDYGPIH